MTHDQNHPGFWRQVPLGAQAMTMRGLDPVLYTVTDIQRIYELNDLGEWHFFTLTAVLGEQMESRVLLAKITNGLMNVLVLEEILSGVRSELLGSMPALFVEPNPSAAESVVTTEIPFADSLRDDSTGIEYALKHRQLYGRCVAEPPILGSTDLLANIAEYAATEGSEILKSDVILLEVFAEDSTEGGMIRLFQGRRADSPNEFQLMPPAS